MSSFCIFSILNYRVNILFPSKKIKVEHLIMTHKNTAQLSLFFLIPTTPLCHPTFFKIPNLSPYYHTHAHTQRECVGERERERQREERERALREAPFSSSPPNPSSLQWIPSRLSSSRPNWRPYSAPTRPPSRP